MPPHFAITINNPVDAEIAVLRKEAETNCKYGIAFREKVSTEHLHAYLIYSNNKTWSSMKKLLPRADIEMVRDHQAWNNYVQKDGDEIFRFGSPPMDQKEKGQAGKAVWTDVLNLAHEGRMDEIERKYPGIYLTHKKKLLAERRFKVAPLETPLNEVNEWLVGDTGTGKTHQALQLAPDAYLKEMNRWWDDYADEDDVIIEEVDADNVEHLVSRFKKWTDKWPFPAETKGGTIKKIRPRRIIVTSNYTIDACFKNEQDSRCIHRRFKTTFVTKGYKVGDKE